MQRNTVYQLASHHLLNSFSYIAQAILSRYSSAYARMSSPTSIRSEEYATDLMVAITEVLYFQWTLVYVEMTKTNQQLSKATEEDARS